ncbi:MAG TPA: HD domain-containing protein [Mycobacterium sp.]|nr:HD domain-containing protein [Mycobacterium sp.]
MTLTRETLTALIDDLAGLPYGGEAVDQRAHALQTGWHAKQAGAADDLLLAATLHDIGRAKPVAAQWPDLPHELSGAAFARAHLGERAAWIIAQHVPAKRYLVATDKAYSAQLSPASIASLQRQGGPMTEAQVAEFRAHPSATGAIMVRSWDDNAKDPGGPELTIAELLDAYDRLTAARRDFAAQ